MAVFLQPIYTQTASGSVNTITFNNIPQTFTDFMILASVRSTYSSTVDYMLSWLNGDRSTIYSITKLEGTGSTVNSSRASGQNNFDIATYPGATATSNTYGSVSIYLPNYTGSNFKSLIIDAVSENNTTAAYQYLNANLYRSTSAITSMTLYAGNGNFTNASTFSLYGILRSGV